MGLGRSSGSRAPCGTIETIETRFHSCKNNKIPTITIIIVARGLQIMYVSGENLWPYFSGNNPSVDDGDGSG